MSNSKKGPSIEIQLGGQKIALRAPETEPELVREVVELVQLKLKDAEKRVKAAAPHQVVLLALLDLAEEYVSARKRTGEFKKKVDEKSQLLLGLIEAELK